MASKSLNKVQLIGNLGKDAELKYTSTQTPVASFSLATNDGYKNEAGEWVDKTEWHNLVVWGKTAESLTEYLTKGQKIYAEGRLQTRSWEGQDGQKRYTTEVVVQNIILLGSKGDGASSHAPHPADAPAYTGEPKSNNPTDTVDAPEAAAPEDVPF